ncbi:uncharacterized protein P174DRAFT_440464 [Aspergillus novofumigatus IBT 16806]|uniref:Uncharacterized protein n=1 Tax=Aspergillus novofumigatus (strain IBT 16806) TaxID=1392255 RepID=A0A2I1CDY4_ASPN1|nr:uncharacterized protein P174DRAFT_440464 [Aspergillus novofumigatus IBT 16806]PKX95844.1 hypothetical protein P174DRAFT_440464 [Aspergillus novofumigatus IBT 16806]
MGRGLKLRLSQLSIAIGNVALRSSICELRRKEGAWILEGLSDSSLEEGCTLLSLSLFIVVISWVGLQCSCLPMTLFMDVVIMVAGRSDFYDALR